MQYLLLLFLFFSLLFLLFIPSYYYFLLTLSLLHSFIHCQFAVFDRLFLYIFIIAAFDSEREHLMCLKLTEIVVISRKTNKNITKKVHFGCFKLFRGK